MEKKNNIGFFILGLLLVGAGILVLANKGLFVKIIVVTAGVYSLAVGFYTLFNISSWHFVKLTKTVAVIKSILSIVVGLVAVIAPVALAEISLGAIQIIVAVILCFEAVVAVQNAIMCRKIDKRLNLSSFAWEALVDAVLAFILFSNPDKALPAVVTVIGVVIIVLGVLCVVLTAAATIKSKKAA
ncbi:MAG: DUF308 domain-containing protein [Sphaerochaetaceae bacterium]|nr:DUF308 domain-containing protein [Sphaerochaetaceae bacterium]